MSANPVHISDPRELEREHQAAHHRTQQQVKPGSFQTAKAELDLHFRAGQKVMMFVDGANLWAAQNALGFQIDYEKLFHLFANTQATLIRPYYYSAILPRDGENHLIKVLDYLDYNGYTMITKDAKEMFDEDGRKRVKGNMDVEIAVDIMRAVLREKIDHVVLFTGDGDFAYLVNAIKDCGAKVTVCHTKATSSSMLADDLRREADCFLELNDLRENVERVYEPR